MIAEAKIRRIAIYERVSSEDQRQRRTIETQSAELARRLANEPGVILVERYIDDGVSGTIPMAKRPAGRRLLEDAAKGRFDEVWVYKVDRLGRDEIDPLVVWRDLEALGVKVHSVTEGISDPFVYQMHVIMAAKERRTFLERSAAGMERAVKEGRFSGGICPLGYEVRDQKDKAQIVPSEKIIYGEWTAADLVRHIYRWLGVEGWSCRKIADHLNSLGVRTAYQLVEPGPRRAERKTGLQAKWRAGRIRNLVVNTIYKGIYRYGKRSKKTREIWEAEVPHLISDDLWQSAQEALAHNRLIAKNTPHRYLLTGLIRCADCGKSYCATHSRGMLWWRCNGKMTSRYDAEGRCRSKAIKSTDIEPLIWQDIERFLFNPGEFLKDLEAEQHKGNVFNESERISLEAQLKNLEQERKGYLRQNAQERLSDEELQGFLDELAEKKAAIEKRLAELSAQPKEPEPIPVKLLEELRRRLNAGLSEEQRQEIARLLVKNITVSTITEDGKCRCRAEVTYRFAAAVSSCTDRDS